MRAIAQGILDFGVAAAGLTNPVAVDAQSVARRIILERAASYRASLARKFAERDAEMKDDDTSHHLLYRALGVTPEEGRRIDAYQNKGRFLYTNAGGFIEEAARIVFSTAFPNAGRACVPNTSGKKPKEFEIDCLIEREAIEIKWRDATTDGDHIAKEEARVRAIHAAGLKPVRVMFYAPNRAQAKVVQSKLRTFYHEHDGDYHIGRNAFDFVQVRTGIDLLTILNAIADSACPDITTNVA